MIEVMSGESERRGTVWVIEEQPPVTRPRWFCHWDGVIVPGFEKVEGAVRWGLSRALTVMVRPLQGPVYFAGNPPDEKYADPGLRRWPPSSGDLERIDDEYRAAVAGAEAEQEALAVYEREREEWLRSFHPTLAGSEPQHECLIFLPGQPDEPLQLEELDRAGSIVGAREVGGSRRAFGTPEQAIASVAGRPVGDPWARAVCATLARERTWPGGRRSMLLVKLGQGKMFHVSPSANRDSIQHYGLDWRRMGTAGGIAGSTEPELPGIFVCGRESIPFFTDMAGTPIDIWEVRVDGLWLEGDPAADGGGGDWWMLVPEPIEPDRLRLIQTDVLPSDDG
jgi:hypothetical protein